MKSFFKSLKAEEVQNEIYETQEHTTGGVSQYIEYFYSPRHLLSR